MTEVELSELFNQLRTALDTARTCEDEPEELDDVDPSPDCRCETCPQGGPYTCISTD